MDDLADSERVFPFTNRKQSPLISSRLYFLQFAFQEEVVRKKVGEIIETELKGKEFKEEKVARFRFHGLCGVEAYVSPVPSVLARV